MATSSPIEITAHLGSSSSPEEPEPPQSTRAVDQSTTGLAPSAESLPSGAPNGAVNSTQPIASTSPEALLRSNTLPGPEAEIVIRGTSFRKAMKANSNRVNLFFTVIALSLGAYYFVCQYTIAKKTYDVELWKDCHDRHVRLTVLVTCRLEWRAGGH